MIPIKITKIGSATLIYKLKKNIATQKNKNKTTNCLHEGFNLKLNGTNSKNKPIKKGTMIIAGAKNGWLNWQTASWECL